MRKYLEVFRLSFKMQLIWRFDVAMTMLATVGRILAAWILWRTMFEGKELINGFTFDGILSYYIISSFLTSLDMSREISGEVSALIRGGRFSGHMVTPMNPFGFFGSMAAGESAFHLWFSLLAAIICSVLFGIKLSLTEDIVKILIAVVMVLLGLAFMAAYQFFIGILAFKFQDIEFFMHIQSSILAFAVGSMIPLSLLPETILAVLRFFPFTYVAYMPTMLLSGRINYAEGLFALAVLSAWSLAMVFVSQYAYNRLRIKYDGVGI